MQIDSHWPSLFLYIMDSLLKENTFSTMPRQRLRPFDFVVKVNYEISRGKTEMKDEGGKNTHVRNM